VRALKNIDLSIAGGKLTVLMGPSGSGKTTLLSILGCMLAPTEGSVFICGHATQGAGPGAARQHSPAAHRVRFSIFSSISDADGRGECAAGARCPREQRRRAKAKSRQVLERVGLGHKATAFPRDLSGGEQQRVAIARAIVAEPSAILADEPTAALDGANGQAIMTILASIAREHGRAVLVVTHDTRLLEFANRILYIEDGALTHEERPAANVYRLRA
jgi:putative ABC transport system ATP-binding protein